MKVIVKTDEYTIFQKRNGRHAVRDASRAWVNGDAKAAILLANSLIAAPAPKAPETEPEAEEAETSVAEATEAATDAVAAETAAAEDDGAVADAPEPSEDEAADTDKA